MQPHLRAGTETTRLNCTIFSWQALQNRWQATMYLL